MRKEGKIVLMLLLMKMNMKVQLLSQRSMPSRHVFFGLFLSSISRRFEVDRLLFFLSTGVQELYQLVFFFLQQAQ